MDDLLAAVADEEDKPTVMGDSAYAGADTLDDLEQAGFDDVKAKVPPPREREGRFGKDDFDVDLDNKTVGCPGGQTVAIRFSPGGAGRADFADACATCPLRERSRDRGAPDDDAAASRRSAQPITSNGCHPLLVACPAVEA